MNLVEVYPLTHKQL